MKKKLPIIIMAAAALILAAAYITLASDNSPKTTGLLFRPKKGEELTGIEIKNSYGDFVFRLENGEWLVSDGDREYFTNKDKMTLLTQALMDFKVHRVLDVEKAEYGIDQPRAAVSFTTDRGREELVVIGSPCVDAGESYAKARGVEGVIIADAGGVAQLTGSINAYRTNEAFVVDLTALRTVEYQKGGETRLAVNADENGQWTMSLPVEAGARKLELDDFVASLGAWTIADYPQSFVPSKGEDEEILILTDAFGESQSLRFGAVQGTLRYVQLGGKENTAALYTADVDLSVLDVDALVYETPLYVSINDVTAVSVNIGGEIFDFTVDNAGQTATLNGKYISYDAFTGVYYRYVLLLADGLDAEGQRGEAVASFKTTLTDGKTRTLVLYERNEDTLFMSYGEKDCFYLETQRLQLLYDRIAALLTTK